MRFVLVLLLFITSSLFSISEKKTCVVMVYMGLRNDLAYFAEINLQQMQHIGSNNNISIVVRKNTIENGKNATHTLLIQKKRVVYLPAPNQYIDSADLRNIVEFCTYVIKNFVADYYALIFWDHGTGPLRPTNITTFKSTEKLQSLCKGVCFDDNSMTCLSEKNIATALATITTTCLLNKKIDIIGFDACSMATLEVAYNIAPFANYMIASQTLEPATGWNYEKIFSVFEKDCPDVCNFVNHIVKTYKTENKDPQTTLSAIDLRFINALSHATSNVAKIVNILDMESTAHHVIPAIKTEKDAFKKTLFEKEHFVDLLQLNKNLLQKTENLLQQTEFKNYTHFKELKTHLQLMARALQNSIFINGAQTNASFNGLSIYLPPHVIDASYNATEFCKNTDWVKLINTYLRNKKNDYQA